MSLFLKIFLWFWLALAMLIGAFIFVSWTTQNEPFARQFRNLMTDTFGIQAQTAAQIYQNEGEAGLGEYLERLKSSERVMTVAAFDADGRKLAGDDMIERHRKLYEQTLASNALEIDRSTDDTVIAKAVQLRDGRTIVVMTHMRRFVPPAGPDRGTWIWRIAALLLTGGLVCWGLARYLTRPIGRLRGAAQKLAGGDLSARVGVTPGKGGDEIAQLSRDFDVMAERIETLVLSEKRLTQDISHELRSPLARLGVALEIAKQKSVPETAGALDRIEKEAARLNEMISRLLILSKLESGASLEMESIDFGALIEEVVADADFEARASGRAVTLAKQGSGRLTGSSSLLRSAVENVLRNAVRYTADDTSVDVALAREPDALVVTVRDHGGGVPEAELANLFRPFYRVGEARERKSGGVGLGLAIAERAVHAHKGAIAARNANGGLEVEIRLPLNDARR